MGTIATLNVNLTAGTARFKGGMKSARVEVNTFTQSVSAMRLAVANAFVGGLQRLASGAIRSFVGSLGSAIEAIDHTNDLAERLGSTTRDLEALGYAAKLNGSSFDGMASSVEKMTKALGDSNKQDVFASLGLDQQSLAGSGTLEQFKTIADAINKLPTAAQRFFAATQIFGRGGAELLNTLALGSEGINQLTAEADALGLTLSNAESQGVAKLADSLDQLGALTSGVGRQFLAVLAPGLNAMTQGVIEFFQTSQFFERYKQVVETLGQAIYAAVQSAQLAFRQLEIGLVRLSGTLAGFMADLPQPVAQAMGLDQTGLRAIATGAPIFADLMQQNLQNDLLNTVEGWRKELDNIWSKPLAPAPAQLAPTTPALAPALAMREAMDRSRFVRVGSPAALEYGSAEYRSNQIAQSRPWVKVEAIGQKQLLEDKAQTRLLEQIAGGIQDTDTVSLPR